MVERMICQDEDVDLNMESPCSCSGSLKGRVSTEEVFALTNSVVPGKYKGGLKLWEGSLEC
ncbi:hypothetical protein ACS0TY_007822 [Phlomoides rotata]